MKKLALLLIALMLTLTACVTPSSPQVLTIPAQNAPLANPLQKVELNYAMHDSVTYQQIKDTITEMFNSEMDYQHYDSPPIYGHDYQLRGITIENKTICVFLEWRFQPESKAWLKHDALSWLGTIGITGIGIPGSEIGLVYDTGYDISIIALTPLANGQIIYWGTAKLNNSGKVFAYRSIENESTWIDGPGMATLN